MLNHVNSYIQYLPLQHRIAIIFLSVMLLILAIWPTPSQSIVIPLKPKVIDQAYVEVVAEQANPTVDVTVESGDTLSHVFERAGIKKQLMFNMLTDKDIKDAIERVYPGNVFQFEQNLAGEFIALVIKQDPLNSIEVHPKEGGFELTKTTTPYETQIKYAQATINNSLFLSAKSAGLSDAMTMNLTHIFAWDIDFALEIRKGDQFSLMYEERYIDGKKYDEGPILAAKFINQGREVIAVRYEDPSGKVAYYDQKGHSMKKAFLRTPVDFAYISSSFKRKRVHPVDGVTRAHKGTDYVAPLNTPIKASGDGTITRARYSASYGNVVYIKHPGGIETRYAHMNKFNKNTKEGRRVKQGQIIGYVGKTGKVTGIHLHYEFRVNGVHKNPQTVKLPTAEPIKKSYKADYLVFANNLKSQLEASSAVYAANSANQALGRN